MRSISVSLVLMVAEASIAQDNPSLFSEKDFEEMAVIGRYLHEKMRLEHQCAEKEDTLPCVERICLMANFTSDIHSADFLELSWSSRWFN